MTPLNRLRVVLSVLVWGSLSVGALSQTALMSLSNLALPPGGTFIRSGGWGPRPGMPLPGPPTGSDLNEQYSVGHTARFLPAGGLAPTAAHYDAQLTTIGWKRSFVGTHPSLIVHRYSSGSPSDPMVGSMMVVSFPERNSQFVGIRLVRSQVPWEWQAGGRSGGGGAGGSAPLSVPPIYNSNEGLRLPELRLPAAVRRLELRGGGGSSDHRRQESRLEIFDSPAAVLKALEPQFVKEGWIMQVTGGDAVQAYATFFKDGGEHVVCLLLTSMPGVNAIDVAVWAIRNK